MNFTLEYVDDAELVIKLKRVAAYLGYRMERIHVARCTVGQLARMVGRKVPMVSLALKRPTCPKFACERGKKRILWIEPTDDLVAYLTNSTQGRRNDLRDPQATATTAH